MRNIEKATPKGWLFLFPLKKSEPYHRLKNFGGGLRRRVENTNNLTFVHQLHRSTILHHQFCAPRLRQATRPVGLSCLTSLVAIKPILSHQKAGLQMKLRTPMIKCAIG